jgi:DUF4097 and DUF4098 domain-containing protein YvlB
MAGLALLASASAWTAGISHADSEFAYDLPGAANVSVSNGSVDLHVHRNAGVPRVEAVLHEDRELVVSASGDRAEIAVEGAVIMSFGSLNERVDLYLRDNTALRVDSGSGDVTIEGLALRELQLAAGSGDVEVSDTTGPLRVETGSGDQSFRDVEGSLELRAGSGDIELDSVDGLSAARTSSGDISGSDLRLPGRISIRTGSGDVDLGLDHEEADLTFDLSAGSGDIRVNRTRAEDVFAFGDGPIVLRVETGSGDQTLRTR